MKATFSVLAALVLVSQAHAQNYVDQNGNPVQLAPQQKVVQYDEASNTVVEVAPQQTQTVQVQPAPVIVQQAPVVQQAQPLVIRRVQEQPVTVVEGSLLKESKADQLRKARTDMETDTENKIVEKLEEARMRDEQERAGKLFGNINGAAAASASATATAVVAPAPAPVMAPPVAPPTATETVGASAGAAAVSSGSTSAAAAAAEAKLEVKEDHHQDVNVKEEIRAALDEREASKKQEKQQLFVSGLAGMGEYPDVVNMRGTGAAGFSVGVVNKNRVAVEGSFMYSTYDIEDLSAGSGAFPVFKNLTQYNTSAAVKFQILPGSFRPFIGALASYTYRNYSQANSVYANPGCPDSSSQAIDVGATAGLDIMVSDNFSIGADFKYMTNLTNKSDSSYQQSLVNPNNTYGTPVEELQYYTLSLVGKLLF